MNDTVDAVSKNSTKNPVKYDDKFPLSPREAAARLSIIQRARDYLIASKTIATKRIGARTMISMRDLQRSARADHPERLES